MPATADDRTHGVRNFLYLFFALMIIWLALTSSFHWQELVAGGAVSLLITIILQKTYRNLGLPPLSVKRILYSLIYIGVLFIEILRANLDVAYRVIHPRMPIKPGIVVIKTTLRQDIAKMILANSITLTPGTFTLDILDDRLLIHWINVQSEETEEATRIIGKRFEKYLKVIFA